MISPSRSLCLFAAFILFLAACSSAGPGARDDGQAQAGRELYNARCAACHMQDGTGQGATFPALAGNSFVTAEAGPVIAVVLHGRGGMPPFANILTDEEAAQVITYIRVAWGNAAPAVTEAEVQSAR